MNHSIYIGCCRCAKQETLLTGDLHSKQFNIDDWQPEVIFTMCNECESEIKEKRF